MRHFLILLAISLSLNVLAQQKDAITYELVPANARHYTIKGNNDKPESFVEIRAYEKTDNGINIYLYDYWPGMAAIKRGLPLAVAGTNFLPRFNIVHIGDGGKKDSIAHMMVNLRDVLGKENIEYSAANSVKKGESMGNHEENLRMSTMKDKYPLAFKMPNPVPSEAKKFYRADVGSVWGGGVMFKVYFTNEKVENGIVVKDFKEEAIRVDDSQVEYERKAVFYDKFAYNREGGFGAVYFGDRKKGKENKWSEYRDFTFVTVGLDGKIRGSHKQNFDYVKQVIYSEGVSDPETGEDYTVFVFGKRPYMKKHSDPDHTKYHVLVLDDKGKSKFFQEFKYGEKKYQLKPMGVVANKGKFTLLCPDGYDGVLTHITLDGKSAEIAKMSKEDLKNVSSGDMSKAIPLRNFADIDYTLKEIWNEDGKTILVYNIFKEIEKERKDENYKTIPAVNEYNGFLFLTLDHNTNRVSQQIVAGLSNMNMKGQHFLDVLKKSDGVYTVMASNFLAEPSPIFINGYVSQEYNHQFANEGSQIEHQANFFKINFNTRSIDSFAPPSNFKYLYGTPTYLIEEDELTLLGYDDLSSTHINFSILRKKW